MGGTFQVGAPDALRRRSDYNDLDLIRVVGCGLRTAASPWGGVGAGTG